MAEVSEKDRETAGLDSAGNGSCPPCRTYRAILALREEDRRAARVEMDKLRASLAQSCEYGRDKLDAQRSAEADVQEARSLAWQAGEGVVRRDVFIRALLDAVDRACGRVQAADAARDQALAERDRLRDIITEVRPRAECYDRALAQFGLTSDLIGYVKGALAALDASRAEVVGLLGHMMVNTGLGGRACLVCRGADREFHAALSANPGQGVAEELAALRTSVVELEASLQAACVRLNEGMELHDGETCPMDDTCECPFNSTARDAIERAGKLGVVEQAHLDALRARRAKEAP